MADYQELAAKLLEQETSDEVKALKLKILQRIAEESEVKPTRMPAPRNITQADTIICWLSWKKKKQK